MKRIKMLALGIASALTLTVAGCASGPTISETQNVVAPPAPGLTRIVVYRTGILGAAIQPIIKVGNKETGRCTPNGVFFVDVPKGKHRVSATTEVDRGITVDTTNASTAYVKCSIGFGVAVGRPKVEVVARATGMSETANLAYRGTY